ncbi:MAG: hypothetical protein R3E90_14735 [Marinicella sp.]|nr:hypothetical protein [Xanthomonadales bacterium]
MKKIKLYGLCLVTIGFPSGGFPQAIKWHSIDQGGGVSTQGNIVVAGVLGQVDAVMMERGNLTVSGGYFPYPADLIFENQFD